MAYTPQFTPTYPNGWVDFPSEETLVTAAALQAYDDTLENIEEYLAEFDPNNNLADQYDPEEGTYAVDDYCVYEDTLYQCNTAISEPEDFDPEKWDEVKITDVMGGGGGGSTVSITPTLSTGTKIADFEIDGESGELYAPTGGGGSANIWTGTMAEYEAQASQIPNDTLVNITDDEGEIEVGGEYYSTDERCVGTWTNGKPLYQKTYTGLSISLGTNSWTTLTGVTITNGEDLVKAECYGEYTEQYLLNCTKVHLDSGTGTVEVRNTEASTTLTAITLTYTKTTDSAIPLAVKTTPSYEVYSTDEQIIGQWIDGSPLYRKTINVASFSSTNALIANSIYYGSLTLSDYISNVKMAMLDLTHSYLGTPQTFTRTFLSGQYEADTGTLTLFTIYSRSNVPLTLVIDYTKTSS